MRLPGIPGPLVDEHRRVQAGAAVEYEVLYQQFLRGLCDDATFRARRVFFGVHGRPAPGRVMVRLKTRLGRLRAGQLRQAADWAARYTPGQALHLTPRQNLQFYDVALEDSPGLLKEAAEAGFGVAAAGGPVAGTVTFPAAAGHGPGEPFDAAYMAALLQLRFETDPALRRLPGPFKVGFWRSLHDEESEPGNDVTILPVRRLVRGRLRRGFRLLLGGGLGPGARVETLWKSFVPPEDLYAHLRAVALHFKACSGEAQRPFNRLRHVLKAEGWPAFQEDVARRLEEQPRDTAALTRKLPLNRGEVEARLPLWMHGFAVPLGDGTFLVKGQPLGGRLGAEEARTLADLAERCGDGSLRLTARQQVCVSGVPQERLLAAYQELNRLGLASAFLGSFCACPGAGVCVHGGLKTEDLGRLALEALRVELGPGEATATAGLRLAASACPNGCGRHKSADLGFEGLVKEGKEGPESWIRVYGRPEGAPLSQSLGQIPMRRLADLLRPLVAEFRASSAPDLASFLRQRAGFEALQRAVAGVAGSA